VKRPVAVLLGVVPALLLAPAASADKPVKEPLPAVDVTLAGVCSFDVLQEITTNKELIKTFANGRQLITGAFRVRVTNLDTESRYRCLPRSEHPWSRSRHRDSDGSVTRESHGPWLIWFFEGDLGPGSPGQHFVNKGNFVQTFYPDGRVTIDQQTGSQTDICAALT
jgi:hypothetical protein